MDAVKEEILPERSDGPDPSLKWIIEGTISKYKLSDDKYFNFIIHTSPQWLEGSIKFPKTYYIDLKGDALHKLYVEYSETPIRTTKKRMRDG